MSDYMAEIAAALTRIADAAEVRNVLLQKSIHETAAAAQLHTEKLQEASRNFAAALLSDDDATAANSMSESIHNQGTVSQDDKPEAALYVGWSAGWDARQALLEANAEPSVSEMMDAIKFASGRCRVESMTSLPLWVCMYGGSGSGYKAVSDTTPDAAVRAAWLAVCGGAK